jgi:hypothetical protein
MCLVGKINILLQQTVTHELATIVENTLKLEASNFKNYLLVLDKSIDVRYTSRLAVIVHGVDKDFNITKDLFLPPLISNQSTRYSMS